jgi:hypothetical protein
MAAIWYLIEVEKYIHMYNVIHKSKTIELRLWSMEPWLSIQDEYLECIVNEQLNISLQVHFMKDLSNL